MKTLDRVCAGTAVIIAGIACWSPILTGDRMAAIIVASSFAFVAWLLGGVDLGGAIAGAALAFVFYRGGGWRLFGVVLTVFVITLAATKIAASRKPNHSGETARTAAQVIANLFIPALLLLFSYPYMGVIVCSALAELAADTVSSETGEMVGGTTVLVTRWHRVPAGTNGGISLAGSLAGIAAAYLTATAAFFLGIRGALWIPAVAGSMAMFVDSFLGGTLENKGWLNNEAVNLMGTGSATAIAWAVVQWNG